MVKEFGGQFGCQGAVLLQLGIVDGGKVIINTPILNAVEPRLLGVS